MSDTAAESLAQEIQAGTYAPSLLIDCESRLPSDRNPHVVRMIQFILFSSPKLDIRKPQDPEFLILQQYYPSETGRRPIVDKFIKPLTASVVRSLGRKPLPGSGRTPDDGLEHLPEPTDSSVDIDRIRVVAVEYGLPGYHPALTDVELRARYKSWIADQRRARLVGVLQSLKTAGFNLSHALAGDLEDIPSTVEAILTSALLPGPYQPFESPHPHFALCAAFEQVWEPKGYTRGELISSISLAPGEQLTLDIHSWDKTTTKSEEELAAESELRVSENLTQRDVRTVTREVATQMGGKTSADGTAMIKGVPVKLAGDVSGSVSQNTKRTREKIRERTVQASNTLKSTRKLRIEVSREIGREQRQTRVIANTNRCHTLNCHYFEVLANYLVTTNLVSLEPCLLLPAPTVGVTAAWVLCHEDVLKQALLDKTFLDGFEAARTLETHEEFEEIRKEEASEEVKAYVEAILAAYHTLLDSVAAVLGQSESQLASAAAVAGTLGSAMATAVSTTQQQLRQVLYMAVLAGNGVAKNALEKLKREYEDQQPPRAAIDVLKDFLAVVGPPSYRQLATATMWTGLTLLGFPSGLMNSLVAWGFLLLLPDDAGLFNAVKAASRKLKAMEAAEGEQPTVREGFSTMEVARARVAFEQLRGHIEDNWLHYQQAMWRREHADQRFMRLQSYGAIASVLENELVGFLGHKAAFPITDPQAVSAQIDFNAIIGATATDPAPPQLITLPTHGTLLEATVGECNACEDFIQQSRILDLRVQEAKAREEESEANRYEKRVENGDYSDPKTLTAGKVAINIDGGENQPPT